MALIDDLEAELRTSVRRRDRAVVDALRSALGDIANAEAVTVEVRRTGATPTSHEHVAGSTAGLGATEAQRREVTEDEQRAIVAGHRAQLLAHSERLRQLCRPDEADGARRAADVLNQALAASDAGRGVASPSPSVAPLTVFRTRQHAV
jgi:uncharacterized protein